MDIIQLNNFSNLHDGKNIIFCKTDFLLEEFKHISTLNNKVILISGNSDYAITDNLMSLLPKNVMKWYAQNALSNDSRLIPIPMGVENKLSSERNGHGIGYYDRVELKEKLLNRKLSINPTKKIYSNFQVFTNFNHRNPIKNICVNSTHIDWEEPTLSLEQFFDKILNYEMVVCPAGNGVDTHRLWEVLYSNRIPITIKVGNFKIYELYEELPIIILNSLDELNDVDLINEKLKKINTKNYNLKMIDYSFWKNEIRKNNLN
jgi:hypothetical protein